MSVFLVSTGLALYAGTIVDFVVDFLSVTMSGLAVIILLGRQGKVAALASASIVSLIVMFVPKATTLGPAAHSTELSQRRDR